MTGGIRALRVPRVIISYGLQRNVSKPRDYFNCTDFMIDEYRSDTRNATRNRAWHLNLPEFLLANLDNNLSAAVA